MPRYLIDITVSVDAKDVELAWRHINDQTAKRTLNDVVVEHISEPYPVDPKEK